VKVTRLQVSLEAGADILEQAEWYESQAGEQLGAKWESAVASTLMHLQMYPQSGSLCRFSNSEVSEIRRIRIPGFPRHFVFYAVADGELLIVRVLHGGRDLESLLR